MVSLKLQYTLLLETVANASCDWGKSKQLEVRKQTNWWYARNRRMSKWDPFQKTASWTFQSSSQPAQIYFAWSISVTHLKNAKPEVHRLHYFVNKSLSDSFPRPVFICVNCAAKSRSIFWSLTRFLLIFYWKISSCFRQGWGWFGLGRASPHYFLMTFPAASFHFPPSTTIWYLISTSMLI